MHTLIAFDNKRNNLSSFFQLCGDETRNISVKAKIDYTNIDTDILTPETVKNKIASIEGGFMFAAFSHGDENCLLNNETSQEYISTSVNHNIFQDAFIYTFSCNTARNLGLELKNNGAKSYWGYKDYAWVILEFLEEFSECAIKGLKSLYEGHTVSDSLDQMKQLHTEYIDKLYEIDPEAAGILVQNRESLVVHGDLNIKLL